MICGCLIILGLLIFARFLYEYFMRKPMLSGLDKKHILITGCDTGFGHDLAKRLDSMGCPVFAACYTDTGAEKLSKECSSRLITLKLDVTKEDSIKAAFEYVSEKLPQGQGLWGLVNNAGIPRVVESLMEFHMRNDFQKVLDVNLLGMIDMCTTFLPLIKVTKGRIVNITSIAGRVTLPFGSPYVISKHGAEAYSDQLRCFVRRYGIKVSILEPGFFKTPIIDLDLGRKHTQQGYDRLSQDVKDKIIVPDFVDISCKSQEEFSSSANTNLDLVVDAYIHGLLAVHPKKRYTLGRDAKYIYLTLSYLPSCITDFIYADIILRKMIEPLYRK